MNNVMSLSYYLGAFFPPLVWDSLFSTQGIMLMLLAAYAGAMWMFLSSAPKVYTIMVSDLAIAQKFYEGMLELKVADIPLHYYYNYDQTMGMGATTMDPMYFNAGSMFTPQSPMNGAEGLWYQLKKNAQIHIIAGASYGNNNNQRHVCFDKKALELILLKVQSRRFKYKIRHEAPLNFLVKDLEQRIIELVEIDN